ncbi:putative polyamine transporter [Sesamum angolense]|uniref:Polyamine transporter n=1 Tax=Sesamum angolense TaxID=2727404 RepID=A0AAE1XBA8_9LAMI|nr:putative polyamine transporter [Sesamum angolense]
MENFSDFSSGLPRQLALFDFHCVALALEHHWFNHRRLRCGGVRVISLAPFIVMSLIAIPQIHPHRWGKLTIHGKHSLLPCFCSDPHMFGLHNPSVAVTGAVVVDQILSAVGLFEAELSSSGYQLLGMADLGLLPKFFALRSKRFNTPWVGILVSTLIAIGVSYMSYTDIVASANFLYSLGMLLEFSSFLWLRWKSPQMNRPYRVPLRLPALIVMCLVPSAFLVFIMAIATKTVYLVSGLMTIGEIGWFFLMNVCKSKGLLHFKSNLEDHDL